MKRRLQDRNNRPCPCGSGKSYAACCRNRRGVPTWQKALEEVRDGLVRFAGRNRFHPEFVEAFEFFFGDPPETIGGGMDEESFSRFLEWFIHDYRLSNGHRLIEMFQMEHGNDLSDAGRRLLQRWMETRISLFEVVEVKRGRGFKAVDLICGGEVSVRSAAPPPELARFCLIVGRPVPLGAWMDFPAGVTILPPSARRPLLQLLRGEIRRFRRANPGLGVEAFLREESYVFHDFISDAVSDPHFGGRLTPEGDPFLPAKSVFAVEDENLTERLGGLAILQPAASGRWELRPEGWPAQAPPLGEVALARQRGGLRLELRCISRERLLQGRELLQSLLGGAIRHRLDALGGSLPAGRGRPPGNGKPPAHPGEAEPLAARSASLWLEHWPDTPLAALGGKTPRQMLTAAKRPYLEAYLKELEYEAARSSSGLDVGRLRQELGLPAQPPAEDPLIEQKPRWRRPQEEEVARLLERGLIRTGASEEHVDSAIWLWNDFCELDPVRIRKPAAWAAAVHFSLARVERWEIAHQDLAKLYRVSAPAVKENSRRIGRALHLTPFDDRYCVRHPVDGLFEHLEELRRRGPKAPAAKHEALWDRVEDLQAAAIRYLPPMDGLLNTARERFRSHVEGLDSGPFWENCFRSWFLMDWKIPVRAGRTLLADVAELAAQAGDENGDALHAWVSRPPSFYQVIEAADEEGEQILQVEDVISGERLEVHRRHIDEAVEAGQIVFGRALPVGETFVFLGPDAVFAGSHHRSIVRRLREDLALVGRWNGERMDWAAYRSQYAERLYGLLYRLIEEGLAGG